MTKKIRGNARSFWIFFTPFLLGLIAFTIVPMIWSTGLSFFEAKGTVYPTRFVGLSNFVDFLTDHAFTHSIEVFVIFAAFIVPVTMFLALGLAVLVNSLPRFQMFFRSVYFLPTAVSYVVASLIWKLAIFNGLQSGLVNGVITALGGQAVQTWFIQFPYYWFVLVTVRLWLQVGFYMLLFLAGLQRIPDQLYEAAATDGLNPGWRMFRHITLPQLRTTSVAVLLLLLIAAFSAFDEFYNLMGQSVNTRPPLVYLYGISLGAQDFGHGAAGSLILSWIMFIAAMIQTYALGFASADDTGKRRPPWSRLRRPRGAAA